MVDPRRWSNNPWQRAAGELADNKPSGGGGSGGNGSGLGGLFLLAAVGFAAYNGAFDGIFKQDNRSNDQMERDASNTERQYPSIAVATLSNGAATQRRSPSARTAYESVCSWGTFKGCSVRVQIPAGTPACITYMQLSIDINGRGRIRNDFKSFITSSYPSKDIKKSICNGYSNHLKKYCRPRTYVTCNFK